MNHLAINDITVRRLKRVAKAKNTSPEQLAEQAIHDFLRADAEAAIEREIEAFRQMHPNLLKRYFGQYVAIYQGQLVDHDQDRLALYLRIDNKFPDVPVLMRPVRSEVDRIITIRSPRLERGD